MTRSWLKATVGVLGGVLALGTLGVPAASAAPKVAGEFALPPGTTVGTNNQIAAGPDGNVWLTLDGGHDVAKVTPAGVVTTYDSAAIAGAIGITAGPDGRMWLTQPNAVVSFDPADPAGAVATTINGIGAGPRIIITGPDGNLWTASNNKVIKIPPAAPATFTAYAATGVVDARAVASDGGSVWVADFGGQQIVNVSTAGAVIKAYPVGGGPQGVAAGLGTAGYSNPLANPQTIGLIKAGGQPATTNTPQADPFGVALGTDGAFWFAQFAGNSVGRLTTAGKYSTVGPFSAAAGPRQITAGPGRTLWVTLDTAEKIGKVTGVDPIAVNTTITKKPKSVVKPKKGKKKARVTFGFQASVAMAAFQCKLAGKSRKDPKYRTCAPPTRYRLTPGKYTFKVRAVAAGMTDPSPAKRSFRVKRR